VKTLILIMTVIGLMTLIVFSAKQDHAPKTFVNGLNLDQGRVENFVKGFRHE